MVCPFCLSKLMPEALACGSCGRDLTGHVYLLRRVAELQASVKELESKLSSMEVWASPSDAAASGPGRSVTPAQTLGMRNFTMYLFVPNILLVLVHRLFVFNWDLSPIWLFLVTLLLPMPFGFAALRYTSRGMIFWLIVFAVDAVVVIGLMNIDTAWATFDASSGMSIWPTTGLEWLQNGQFALALYCSFAAGLFACLLYLRIRWPQHSQLVASRQGFELFARRFRIALSSGSIDSAARYIGSVGTIVSVAGALFLGFKRL